MQFKDSQAIYLQIAAFIEEKILRKEWKPDDRIPSVRDLAIEVEVNPNTVVKSFDLLQQKNIIYNKRGIGYFVSDDAYSMILKNYRSQFVEKELPAFFKNLSLLGFSFNEISELYQKQLTKK